MENESDVRTRLLEAASSLAWAIDDEIKTLEIETDHLEELIYKATASEHRRAARNARDAKSYRMGGSFEPVKGLDLDPTAFCGWLAAGTAGVLALVQIAIDHPEDGIPELLETLFRSAIGREIHALGVHARWKFRENLYRQEVERFEASSAFAKPGWRRKEPTAEQYYLVEEIVLALKIERPTLHTRGEAYQYIKKASGNPVFWAEPPMPNLAGLIAEIRS